MDEKNSGVDSDSIQASTWITTQTMGGHVFRQRQPSAAQMALSSTVSQHLSRPILLSKYTITFIMLEEVEFVDIDIGELYDTSADRIRQKGVKNLLSLLTDINDRSLNATCQRFLIN
ncbi:hypothetical protein KIN20_015043 [Parelaphostrongylus tenuis]|uniref:Uncharacterized protein n=1 Tax=Parelaphostrongylus tenuis TaxID=148309 RepID=A0AAD5QS86_PARTN|nr:hypothetical protein KIN20_015043 [Parelaphostrongylus tenuis]